MAALISSVCSTSYTGVLDEAMHKLDTWVVGATVLPRPAAELDARGVPADEPA